MNIVVVGHVDHGKSTVVGRLLADTKSLPEGKLEAIRAKCERESKVFEYAFILDALKDEQSQGITIDSARCFFKTDKRDYIIIDAPGHVEFLKNMISGASRAEAALLVIDAQEGIQENSRRHGYMLGMLGIKQVIVLINKMDLVGYDYEIFKRLVNEYTGFLLKIGIIPNSFIAVSALNGENITFSSNKMSWCQSYTVLEALDSFEKEEILHNKSFRMPVQDIYKFTVDDDKRIIAGRIESGTLKEGDEVIFLPSGKRTSIDKIIGNCGTDNIDYIEAYSGCSIGVTLKDQTYISRGQIMCKLSEELSIVGSLIKANIFWMGKSPLVLNKEYRIKIGTNSVLAKVKSINNVLNASDLSISKKEYVDRNEVAECIFECQNEIAFDPYSKIPITGRFVIVDDHNIAGGGIIVDSVESLFSKSVGKSDREILLRQKGKVLWFTGLSGSGKSTISLALQKKLLEEGKLSYILDGDVIRNGLCSDLGFSKYDRAENSRRVKEVAKILLDCGMIVIVAFISPYKKDRDDIKKEIPDFVEVFVDCPLEVCEKRDVKGLYKKARSGEISNFTGVNDPYEIPLNPDIRVDTSKMTLEECVKIISEIV